MNLKANSLWKKILKENRVGEFIVPWDIFNNYPQIVRNILEPLLIINADARFDVQGFKYIAYGSIFDPHPACMFAPAYMLDIILGESNLTQKEKLKHGIPSTHPIGWRFIKYETNKNV
jgi:hypothetical protein